MALPNVEADAVKALPYQRFSTAAEEPEPWSQLFEKD